jgi:acetyltransferase-like isoleucine patch superfamily enzyme
VKPRAWQRIRLKALTPPAAEAFGAFGASFIVPPARIENPQFVFIGDGVAIHEEVWMSVVETEPGVTPRLSFGDRTRVGRFCQFSCVGRIEIGNDVLISDEVQIGDTFHQYSDVTKRAPDQLMAPSQPVRICDGALIGMGAVVLPGVTVGAGAYVSEATVVNADVPPRSVVAGNPGRHVRSPQR